MANPNIVNVSSIHAGNMGFNLQTTLSAILFSVSTDYLVKVNRIVCANVDGTSAADLTLYLSSIDDVPTGISNGTLASTAYIAKTMSVPADTTLVVLDSPIYMAEGDVLHGGASANSSLDLIISYEVINDA